MFLLTPFRKGLLLLSVAVSMAALAQSPYQGAWSGTFTYTTTSTCTATGPGGTSTYSQVCTGTQPWTGNVDSTGKFSLFRYAGTGVCTTSAPQSIPIALTSTADSAVLAFGIIDSKGTDALPANTVTNSFDSGNGTATTTCPAFTMQFAGTTMSSTESCSQTSHDVIPGNPPVTGDCSGTYVPSYTGAKGSGVLTPSAPVFPISVTSNITATTATATAQVSPPASQVGSTGSIYVFAHVRQSKLTAGGMGTKRMAPPAALVYADGNAPDPCVLAQLNPGGQLTAASASTLQPYATGVLGSQSQSVTILNSVPTPNVSGASFFVGYGSTSGSMVSNGTYQGAVTVAGSSGCSGALLAGAAPNSPAALSGLWWDPTESGWGISFTQRRNVVFGAWYTYDASGKPKWYVASNCALPAGVAGTSGTCMGTLYQVSGPTFFGATFNPSLDHVAAVGTLTIAFADANNATMSYSVNGQARTLPIVRQSFQTGSTVPAVDYTDLWWNPNESGWGMVITQQYGVMFLAWYVYDSAGNPVWYVAPDCVVVGSTCSGSAYSTIGPPLGPTFDHNAVHATQVGAIAVNFVDANNATVTYTVNGSHGNKDITRQTF